MSADQISTDPRSRRRRTLHPDQRTLPLEELAAAQAVHAYSFILTNLDISTPQQAAAVEHWYRHRTTIENTFRDAKHGAALRHLPSGYVEINTAWMWGALIATLRHRLVRVPARLIRHSGALTLRLPPDHQLLTEVLTRLRALPTTS